MRKQNVKSIKYVTRTAALFCLFCLGNLSLPISQAKENGNTISLSMTDDEAVDSNGNHLESISVEGRLYGIGSVSKVYTAAAIMQLAEKGMINLDQPLTAYIPDFEMADIRYQNITPRMLLNHSSGFMGMSDNNAFLLGDNSTYNHDHFLNMLKNQRLKHDPGELSVYSNDSFTMAEILVERVSGKSFTAYLEANILKPLGLNSTFTPQSDFDRSLLSPIYWNGRELLPQNLNLIGSGGIYASMEDLSQFGQIFTQNGSGILSANSAAEMSAYHHIKPLVPKNSDSIFHYGLGWDSVETYPFTTLGIKALAKGGGTGSYHTNLTVLPEYNLSVAVSSSGQVNYEQLIAQEIILEILKEEGLIDSDLSLALPEYNTLPSPIPDSVQSYAGLYDSGTGMFTVSFTEDTMLLTTVNSRVEKTAVYIYNQDNEFISSGGDYITLGFTSNQGGTRGISRISFTVDEKGQEFMIATTYENVSGLSQSAYTHPIAQKITPLTPDDAALQAWEGRNGKKYLLVNEIHSSQKYLSFAAFEIKTDERAKGYVTLEAYQMESPFCSSVISDASSAMGFQKTPTQSGRDIRDIHISQQNGDEILHINDYLFIEEAAVPVFPDTGNGNVQITTGNYAKWYRTGDNFDGQSIRVELPENSSLFLYDEDLKCIYSSLELNFDDTITLPENGYIAFVGMNSTFTVVPS